MKLESLKSSKFEAFKGNEITNTMAIRGGENVATKTAGGGSDCWNKDSGKVDKDFDLTGTCEPAPTTPAPTTATTKLL